MAGAALHGRLEDRIAEVLEDDEPFLQVEGLDLRRREAAGAECFGDGDEGGDVFSQMHECAIGLAVPDWRAVGLPRRVHENRAPVGLHEARIAARGRISLQVPSVGFGKRGPFEEARKRLQPVKPARPISAPREYESPRAGFSGLVENDVQAVLRQPAGGPFGPFDQQRPVRQRIVQAQLLQFAFVEAVEVAMAERQARRVVALNQAERGAWHFALAVEMADQRPGQSRLPGAEGAGQGHDIACLEVECDPAGKSVETVQIDTVKPPNFRHPALVARMGPASVSGVSTSRLSGSSTVKRDPCPGWLLSETVPPWSSARLLTMERPRPAPR